MTDSPQHPAMAFRVLIHATEVLENTRRLAQPGVEAKVSMALRQMLASGRPNGRSKPTSGLNKGWLRLPLAGNNGSHFYLYWAPQHPDPAVRASLGPSAVVARAVLHHDSTSDSLGHDSVADFVELELSDRKGVSGLASPFTDAQDRFAGAKDRIRYFQGAAGGGKTQALWRAVELGGEARTLYLTWSPALAKDAQQHFSLRSSENASAFLPSGATLQAMELRDWWAKSTGRDVPFTTLRAARAMFRNGLAEMKISPRALGYWRDRLDDLFAELMAHLFGAVDFVPELGLPNPADYVSARRDAGLDAEAATAAFTVARQFLVTFSDGEPSHPSRWLPEIFAARQLHSEPRVVALDAFDRIVIDEVQDLTGIELQALLRVIGAQTGREGAPIELIMAGDEAQTVRPTGFRHAQLKSLVYRNLRTRVRETVVEVNLRCPESVVDVLDRIRDLYKELPKQARPAGARLADAIPGSPADLVLALLRDGREARALLQTLSESGNAQAIVLSESFPNWLENRLEERFVMTPEAAKGLEFPIAVVLGAGELIGRVRAGQLTEADVPWLRTQLDRLTVAVSRTNGALILAEVGDANALHVRYARDLLSPQQPAPILTVPQVADYVRDGKESAAERVNRLYRNAVTSADDQPHFSVLQLRMAADELARGSGMDSFVAGERLMLAANTEALIMRLLAGDALASDERARAVESIRTLTPFLSFAVSAEHADAVSACATCLRDAGLRSLPTALRIGLLTQVAELQPTPVRDELFRQLRLVRSTLLPMLRAELFQPPVAAQLGPRLSPILEALEMVTDSEADSLIRTAIVALLKAGELDAAEQSLAAWPRTPEDLHLELLERQAKWELLADLHLRSGRVQEAAYALRCAGRTDEAAHLCRDPEVRSRLRGWRETVDWLERERALLVPFEHGVLFDTLTGENLAFELKRAAAQVAAEKEELAQARYRIAERERTAAREMRLLDEQKLEFDQRLLTFTEREQELRVAESDWQRRNAQLAAHEAELLSVAGTELERERLRALANRRTEERDDALFEVEQLKEQFSDEAERHRQNDAERERLRVELTELGAALLQGEAAREQLSKNARRLEKRVGELSEQKASFEASLAEFTARDRAEKVQIDEVARLRERINAVLSELEAERSRHASTQARLAAAERNETDTARRLRDAATPAGALSSNARPLAPGSQSDVHALAPAPPDSAEPRGAEPLHPTQVGAPPNASFSMADPTSSQVSDTADGATSAPAEPAPEAAQARKRFLTVVTHPSGSTRRPLLEPDALPAPANSTDVSAPRPASEQRVVVLPLRAERVWLIQEAEPPNRSPEIKARLRTVESAHRLLEAFHRVPPFGIQQAQRRLLMMGPAEHARLLRLCRTPADNWTLHIGKFGLTGGMISEALGLPRETVADLLEFTTGYAFGSKQRLSTPDARATLDVFGAIATLSPQARQRLHEMRRMLDEPAFAVETFSGTPMATQKSMTPATDEELDAYRLAKPLTALRPHSAASASINSMCAHFGMKRPMLLAIICRVTGLLVQDETFQLSAIHYAEVCDFVGKLPTTPI